MLTIEEAAKCSVCASTLDSRDQCLSCLLRGGLDEAANDSLGGFTILRREDGTRWELGHGAMGVTYRARDENLQRPVALKVIELPTNEESEEIRTRFLREARLAAALHHPNIAAIYHYGATAEEDRCFYAMELVEGETLEARVRRDGPLSPNEARSLGVQIARALVAAAAQGLVHRDLKPANVMLVSPNEGATCIVKVIDFGLAKTMNALAESELTQEHFIGTPAYASPEQFRGAPADARSDIYSLGVTLWYALTGQVPYPGQTATEILEKQTRDPLPMEQLAHAPERLGKILQRTLALDPAARPASALELLGELEASRISPWKKSFALAIAAVLVAASILAAWLIFENNAAPTPAEEAPPTNDQTALAYYNSANSLFPHTSEGLRARMKLLEQALERDRNFLLARVALAHCYDIMVLDAYFNGHSSETENSRHARNMIDEMLRAHPDRGEPYLALALHYFVSQRYQESRRELEIAQRLLPNNPEVLFLQARLDRHDGYWAKGTEEAQHATKLAPQDVHMAIWTAESLLNERHYAEGETLINWAQTHEADGAPFLSSMLALYKFAEGDNADALALAPACEESDAKSIRLRAALYARDFAKAETFLVRNWSNVAEQIFLARALKDPTTAGKIIRGYREELDKVARGTNEWFYGARALCDAGLGEKEEMVRDGQRALAIAPIARDPVQGPDIALTIARADALVGNPSAALESLEQLAKIPSSVCYGDLRDNPIWDGLRGERRFEKLVEELKPSGTLASK